MHAADDAVGGEHEIAARGRRDRGGVVGEPEGAGMLGDRREIARDQTILAETRFASLRSSRLCHLPGRVELS